METIRLSELLGQRIKKVHSGSELIFMYELSKYTKEILGKTLDFEDIQLVKELKVNEYYLNDSEEWIFIYMIERNN